MNWRSEPLIATRPPLSYRTAFSGAPENPISEGGVWSKLSTINASVATVTGPNRAVGTQPGGQGLAGDSIAHLSGFQPNVLIQATVYKDPTIDATDGEHELELHVRMTDTSAQATTYECNISSTGAYAQIVRWDVGSFTYLAGQFGSSFSPAPATGDVFKVTVIGSTITTYIKRASDNDFVQLQQATDSTYATGQPGMGMFLKDAAQFANQSKFAFTDFYVTEV